MPFLDEVVMLGGLQNPDVYPTRLITVYTGSKDEKSKRKVVVGDTSIKNLLDMNLELSTFLKAKNPYQAKDYVTNIVRIYRLPRSITTVNDLIFALRELNSMTSEQYISWVSKQFKIYDSLILATQSLFWCWKTHLEDVIKEFNEMRSAYIQKHIPKGRKSPVDKINDLEDLIEKWSKIDAEYHIESSSPILLYFNPPSKPTQIPWIKESYGTSWENLPKFEIMLKAPKEVQNTLAQFQFALSNWTYLGFCRCKPITRLLSLFNFPIKELVSCISMLNQHGAKSRFASHKKYCELFDAIKAFKTPIKPQFSILDDSSNNANRFPGNSVKSNENSVKSNDKFVKTTKKNEGKKGIQPRQSPQYSPEIAEIRELSKTIAKRLTTLKPELVKLENYYIDIAIQFNKIAKKIDFHLL